ncbi:MAG: DUF294 nucleotidyltransferase-like domain-containing protein [Burkholderiaceae bacterium]
MTEPRGELSELLDCAPLSALPSSVRQAVLSQLQAQPRSAGERIYAPGESLPGLLFVVSGELEIRDAHGAVISVIYPGESFGGRGLVRDGLARSHAVMTQAGETAVLPSTVFDELLVEHGAFADFFQPRKARITAGSTVDMTARRVGEFMTRSPITIEVNATALQAARLIEKHRVSCLLVMSEGRLAGILTTSDLVGRVLAARLVSDTPVKQVMTSAPRAVDVNALGHDTFLMMSRARIGHLPVMQGDQLVGIVTRSDLLAHQAASASLMVLEIDRCRSVESVAAVVRRLPDLLVQLNGAGVQAGKLTRLMTDIGDAATRRFLTLAEEELGPPPVAYLWLACGSQGRQEQTGVSDQDNCLILHDDVADEHLPYFAALAGRVSDALDTCGYFYCPGDMMATNPKWCQPLRVWREYFEQWVRQPEPMAQMLASVMFDLRPLHGDVALFNGLHEQTLRLAQGNSIFVAHMAANSVRSSPPLGLLGGLATIRSGEHKRHIDFKHAGVVPVVDLARLYALQGRLTPVNTRERLLTAREGRLLSESGALDLLDAYDLICEIRLDHQAAQVRAGQKPDNYVLPAALSDLQRDHLRDAFAVIKRMQSSALQGRASLA